MFIDAKVIYGQRRGFGCSIEVNENADIFKPFDLSPYSIIFKVLGSSTANGEVLVEHIITQNSDEENVGVINDPTNGQFIFVVSEEDTYKLGLGQHPIMIEIVDAASLSPLFTLTEGEQNGEFSKIQIVQV